MSKVRRSFAWAFVSQGFSSASNFALSVIAGRLLGPQGLGTVVIGFTTYQLVAGLQRAVITQPLVVEASPLPGSERKQLASSGLDVITATGVIATLLLLVSGLIAGGRVGTGLLAFAPWLVAALLQEYWKAIIFQEGRGELAALSDALRFVVMLITLPVALEWRDEYVVVGTWGFATVAGLVVVAAGLHVSWIRIEAAFRVWRDRAWLLGRWLGARELVYQFATTSTIFALAGIIGTTDLGGLRSAESLFSPFSLIAAALILPALPALSRALVVSQGLARRLTLRITAGALAIGLAYFLLMIAIGPWLLTHLFGQSFSAFNDLVWPMAAAQLFYASSFAANALLSAEKRGAASFAVGSTFALSVLVLATTLGAAFGVKGAAWGMALGAAVGSVVTIAVALRAQAGMVVNPAGGRASEVEP